MTINGTIMMILILVFQVGIFAYLLKLAAKDDREGDEENLSQS